MQEAHFNETSLSDEVEMDSCNNKTTLNGIALSTDDTSKQHKDIFKSDVETLVVGGSKDASATDFMKQSSLRCVIVLLVLGLCIAVITLAVFYIQNKSSRDLQQGDKSSAGQNQNGRVGNVCLTSGCITVSSRLIQSANLSADPCHDFFEYSCGGWKANNFLPDSKSQAGGFSDLKEKAANVIKRALDSKSVTPNGNSAVDKLVLFFRSCLDETTLNKRGSEPLLKLLDTQGSWPLLNSSWDESHWTETDAFVRNHRVFFSYFHVGRPSPIFNTCVKVDDKNSSEHIIQIDEPQFNLVPYLYQSNLTKWNKILTTYEKMMKQYIKLLGGNTTSADIKEMSNFEMSLANVSSPSAVFRDIARTYKRMNLSDFIKETGSSIDWLKYLTEIFRPFGVNISTSTQIATRSLVYLKKANNILKSSNKRTLANYLAWVIVHKFAPHLSAAFRDADFEFRKGLTGLKKDDDLWKKCFRTVQQNMDMAVANVFVEAGFDPQKKVVAKEIMKGYKEEFLRVLKSSEWMDDETKLEASEKAKLMIDDIGYPDFVIDKNKLDEYYKDLSIAPDDYFQNLLNAYQVRRRWNLGMLKLPINKRQWDIPPTEVNAYYDVANNKMVFLAGLMDVPFFEVNGPMSVKYSSFGFVVGHETTHGFDDQGRLYDKNGNLRSWWSQESANRFKRKADCIEKQFSAYKYFGLNVNGKQTLGENLADLGGIEVAYKAYKHWEKVNGVEPQLPALNLTSDQLFFLSHGQVWCTIYNEQKGRETILHDLHSLPNLRVNGPLSNMDEFSKAFNCPMNCKMNRKNKCKLWSV
eukprot:gene282-907_t